MKYIFLDFDGVLHGNKQNTEPFCLLDNFEERLKPHEDKFKIVISSSWRNLYDFNDLKEILFLKLNNVIGITPDLGNERLEFERYEEVRQYCTINKIGFHNCLCVDDSESLFPWGYLFLLLTDSDKGITNEDIDKIIEFINHKY